MKDLYYIEDDPNIALAVREYLEPRGFRVSVCATFAEAKRRLCEKVLACVFLDWNMLDGCGGRFCRWIRENWKDLPVIFLTICSNSPDIVAGFRNAADDYVVKPFSLEVLHYRILAVLRRTGGATERYLSCGGIRIDQERHTVSCRSEEISLSAAEYQLLLCLMRNKGRTVTRKKLLEQVWDVNGNYVNDNTLTVTMKRLRDKLSQPECLKTVRSVGCRMVDMSMEDTI